MIAREAIVTVDQIDGFQIVKTLGYVHGQAVRPRDIVRSTFRSIGAFIGLAPIEYLTDAERAREEALEAMRQRADVLGANGVIKVQFQITESGDGTKVLCYGQAIILARES
ncbi:MAG: YbjQ family protein [Candidatus Eremiobacteraeota bacterium]|nr:YbjQ family protein [Candidatus Eremiobacteraeota bacterium]